MAHPVYTVINSYKAHFVLRRLIQTFLGGPRFFLSESGPLYYYIFVTFLFLFLPIVGFVCSVLFDAFLSAIVLCVVFLFEMVICFLVSLKCHKRKSSLVVPLASANNILKEEDSVDFDGVFGSHSLAFLFPQRSLTDFVWGLFWGVGVVICASVVFSSSKLEQNLDISWPVVSILGWFFSFGTVIYSNAIEAPPEPVSYSLHRKWFHGGASAYRSFFFMTFSFLALFVAYQLFIVILLFLPLLFLFQILPPLDAYLPYLCEQVGIVLGGTASTSDVAAIFDCFLSLLSALLLWLSLSFSSSPSFFPLVISTVFGFVCSSLSFSEDAVLPNIFPKLEMVHNDNTILSKKASKGQRLLRLVLFLAACLTSFLSFFHSTFHDVTLVFTIIFGGACFFLLTIAMFRELQHPFLFGIFRNSLYFRLKTKRSLDMEGRPTGSVLDHPLVGSVHRVLLLAAPLFATVFLAILCAVSSTQFSFELSLEGIWHSVCLFRLSRLSFQNPEGALWHQAVTGLLFLLFSSWKDKFDFIPAFAITSFILSRFNELLSKLNFFSVYFYTALTSKKLKVQNQVFLVVSAFVLLPFSLFSLLAAVVLSVPLLPVLGLPVFLPAFPRPSRLWPRFTPHGAGDQIETALYVQLASELAHHLPQLVMAGALPFPTAGAVLLIRVQNKVLWATVLSSSSTYVTLVFKGLELQETDCHHVEAAALDDAISDAFNPRPTLSAYNPHTFGEDAEFEGQLQGVGASESEPNMHKGKSRSRSRVVQSQRKSLFRPGVFMNAFVPQMEGLFPLYSDADFQLTGIIDFPDNLRVLPSTFLRCLVYHIVCRTPFSQSDIHDFLDSCSVSEDTIDSLIRKFPMKWYLFLLEKDPSKGPPSKGPSAVC
eukprot:GCRY01003128.1.p1 GENE.GCRY01003128.1~~GCRY01003128.1.p1  ORF type:complete len:878 (+),score=107.36 GCRY01003128.1:233-2866(+)